MSQLENLYLGETGVTDRGLIQLKPLGKLKILYLHDNAITDDGLQILGEMSSLECLSLIDTQITDAGLEHLKKLKNLNSIAVRESKVTKAGLERFEQAMPNCKTDAKFVSAAAAEEPTMPSASDRVRAQTLRALRKVLQTAIAMYALEHGKYPQLSDGWEELTQAKDGKGPYVKGIPSNVFTGGTTVANDDSADWKFDLKTHKILAVVPFDMKRAEALGLSSEDVVVRAADGAPDRDATKDDKETRAKAVALKYLDALADGDSKTAVSLSAVPFSLDKKYTVKTLDELKEFNQKIAGGMKGHKIKPTRILAFQGGDDPHVTVMIWVDDESVSVFVRPGKDYRVVGFED